MEWKRAKNIILCVLLFANLFLAVNLGTLISSRLTEQKDKTAIAIENLIMRGHKVADNAERKLSYDLYTYNIKRSSQFESQIATALLGQCEREDKGGGIEEYSSSVGQCTFRSGGNFLCEIYGRNIEDDFEKNARQLIKAMDIKKYELSSLAQSSAVFVTDAANKYEIEDYSIKIEQTTRGVQISGRLLDIENASHVTVSPDYAKILIKLATLAEKEGVNLNISAMEVIYQAEYIQADETVLTPYLRLSEGGKNRYVNLNTSEIIKN